MQQEFVVIYSEKKTIVFYPFIFYFIFFFPNQKYFLEVNY